MSSASMRAVRMTSAGAGTAAADRKARPLSARNGVVSRISRWRVQSPPRSTLSGTPGSGMSEPNWPLPPANWNDVT